jgi:hypothetical protein
VGTFLRETFGIKCVLFERASCGDEETDQLALQGFDAAQVAAITVGPSGKSRKSRAVLSIDHSPSYQPAIEALVSEGRRNNARKALKMALEGRAQRALRRAEIRSGGASGVAATVDEGAHFLAIYNAAALEVAKTRVAKARAKLAGLVAMPEQDATAIAKARIVVRDLIDAMNERQVAPDLRWAANKMGEKLGLPDRAIADFTGGFDFSLLNGLLSEFSDDAVPGAEDEDDDDYDDDNEPGDFREHLSRTAKALRLAPVGVLEGRGSIAEEPVDEELLAAVVAEASKAWGFGDVLELGEWWQLRGLVMAATDAEVSREALLAEIGRVVG